MKIFIVELMQEGQDSQVAVLVSSFELAIQWVEEYGVRYGDFSGFETPYQAKYYITSQNVDEISGLSFESFGCFDIVGEELPSDNA